MWRNIPHGFAQILLVKYSGGCLLLFGKSMQPHFFFSNKESQCHPERERDRETSPSSLRTQQVLFSITIYHLGYRKIMLHGYSMYNSLATSSLVLIFCSYICVDSDLGQVRDRYLEILCRIEKIKETRTDPSSYIWQWRGNNIDDNAMFEDDMRSVWAVPLKKKQKRKTKDKKEEE